ncbi:hypothetical protein Tco_0139932 [Tanacetum coccineum]
MVIFKKKSFVSQLKDLKVQDNLRTRLSSEEGLLWAKASHLKGVLMQHVGSYGMSGFEKKYVGKVLSFLEIDDMATTNQENVNDLRSISIGSFTDGDGDVKDSLLVPDVENLVPIPSEPEVTSDNESECDVPVNDASSPIFTTLSNPLFDYNDDLTSSDDKSLSNEDVLMENFKIYSNPLFDDEEIISPKIDPHYFNAESNLIESLLNRDILIDSSPKFDYLLEEFSGELAHIDPIPPGIEKADFDLEEEIRLVENLLYDNSSPRPPKELNLEIADTILESLSPSPILVADSDSLMEEIDLFLASDDSMPPGIENDDYDSEGDIRFLEELLNNDSFPLPENESSILDCFNDPSPSRSPPELPDVEICFDFKPDTGVVTNKVVGDIFEHDVLMPNLLPTQPTICPVFDLLLPFSSENEDKVFNPGFLKIMKTRACYALRGVAKIPCFPEL